MSNTKDFKVESIQNTGFYLSNTFLNPDTVNGALDKMERTDIGNLYSVIGAQWSTIPSTSSGIVYVLNNSDGSLRYTIQNPNHYDAAGGDLFGTDVAINDTYIVVSARGEDNISAAGIGIVYVFNTSDGLLAHTIENPDPVAGQEFGIRVGINDTNTIIIGSPNNDNPTVGSGLVYLFNAVDGLIIDTITNPNVSSTTDNDNFGTDVSISNTYFAASAVGEDTAVTGTGGAVYVFNLSDKSLKTTFQNHETNTNVWGYGLSIGMTDNHLIVSAYASKIFAEVEGNEAGAAFVYDLNTELLTHELSDPKGAVDWNETGVSVAISNKYAYVGSGASEEGLNDYSGQVFIFDVFTGRHIQTISNPNSFSTSAGDGFAYSDLAVNVNNMLIVPAYAEDSTSGSSSGTVYTFTLDNTVNKLYNSFNGPNQLVKTDVIGKLPNLDGSNLTGVQAPLVAGTDYQAPLVAGTDYQAPLVAGTDYQAPLVAGTDYLAPAGDGSNLTNTVQSNITQALTGSAIYNMVTCTQAQYDAITPDSGTFYIIIG